MMPLRIVVRKAYPQRQFISEEGQTDLIVCVEKPPVVCGLLGEDDDPRHEELVRSSYGG